MIILGFILGFIVAVGIDLYHPGHWHELIAWVAEKLDK